MKKLLLFTLVFFVITVAVSGQHIENPGFEDWEDAGTITDEPVNWSSIKTSDGGSTVNNAAPQVWVQSEDAHTGSYSVKLYNVYVPIISRSAAGTLTNGRVHASFNPEEGYVYTDPDDERWHTSFHWRPDSLTGWFKYYPRDEDFGQIKAVLHRSEGRIPTEDMPQENLIGYAQFDMPSATIDEWTRFSVPFTYYYDLYPQYILFVLTAGNGLDAIDSSWALLDDLEFIYNNLGVHDLPGNKYNVYSYDHTIFLNDLPVEMNKDAEIELIDLNGRVVWSGEINTSSIHLDASIRSGLYVITIKGKQEFYTQKLYVR